MKSLYDKSYFKASNPFQKNKYRIQKLTDLVLSYNPSRVLDVGCGIGYLVKSLSEKGVIAHGCDFAEDLNEYWNGDGRFQVADAKKLPFEDQSYDLVVSTDFFEHIDEPDIDTVANEMKRVGKKVITFVADDKGEKLRFRQTLYHVSNKPLNWWRIKLQGIDVFSSKEI